MNKTNYVGALLAVMLLLGSCKSSTHLTDQAGSLYKKGNYVAALDHYNKILAKKPYYTLELLRNISFSYYRLGQYKQAEKYFKIMFSTFDSSYSDKEALFALYKVLEANKDKGEANKIRTLFVTQYPNDSRAKRYRASLVELGNLERAPILFYKTAMYKSNGQTMRGIPGAIVGDRMLVSMKKNPITSVSYKKNLVSGKRTDYNLYTVRVNPLNQFKLQGNTNFEAVRKLNSSYDDYGAATSKSGDVVFFSSNRPTGKSKDSISIRNVIYMVKVTNGSVFGEVKKVPFDDGVSDYKTPFLSKDGKTLYFSSNKPGGFGGYDLYKVGVSKGLVFSKELVNMGRNINTEADEIYPYVSVKNKLYFSSNGLFGFGGYDIFENSLGTKQASVNLGKDVNSSNNELSFIFDEAKKIGFYTSNTSLYGEDQMFSVKRIDQSINVKACRKNISLNIYDSLDRFPLEDVTVYLSDSKGKFIESGVTDSEGFISFSVDCYNNKLNIKFSKKGYSPLEKKGVDINVYNMQSVIFLNKQGIVQGKNIEGLTKGEGTPEELFVNKSYINFDLSGYNLKEESIKVLDKMYSILAPYKDKIDLVIVSHADRRGTVASNKVLSIRRANTIFDYLVSKGFPMKHLSITPKGELDPIVNCDNCTKEEYAKNRRTLFKIIPRYTNK